MENHLHFICPSDGLEALINYTFKGRNYYYTSLGNSIVFNVNTTWQIQKLIHKNNIDKISFILSNDNRIVLDALGNQDFLEITELNGYYNEIIEQKDSSEISWQKGDLQFSILSYYLNKKIKEFQLQVNSLFRHQIKMNGQIYNKDEDSFKDIYPNLICMPKFRLN